MKKIAIIMAAALAFSGVAFAGDVMEFAPNCPMGKVTFNHKKHQETVKDCKACHEKAPGKIEGFSKDWAHKTCKECHAKRGAVKCGDCHKK
jgi:hypothetical protein